MEFAGCSNDQAFGPSVHGCRGDFDFTIKFEKIFFSLIPSSIIVAIAAPRLIALTRRTLVVTGAWFQFTKLVRILRPKIAHCPQLHFPVNLSTHTALLTIKSGLHLNTGRNSACADCPERKIQNIKGSLPRLFGIGFSRNAVHCCHQLVRALSLASPVNSPQLLPIPYCPL